MEARSSRGTRRGARPHRCDKQRRGQREADEDRREDARQRSSAFRRPAYALTASASAGGMQNETNCAATIEAIACSVSFRSSP